MSAFYLKGVAPKSVTLNQIFNGMYPFMVFQIIALVVLWFLPQLATALPEAIYGTTATRALGWPSTLTLSQSDRGWVDPLAVGADEIDEPLVGFGFGHAFFDDFFADVEIDVAG